MNHMNAMAEWVPLRNKIPMLHSFFLLYKSHTNILFSFFFFCYYRLFLMLIKSLFFYVSTFIFSRGRNTNFVPWFLFQIRFNFINVRYYFIFHMIPLQLTSSRINHCHNVWFNYSNLIQAKKKRVKKHTIMISKEQQKEYVMALNIRRWQNSSKVF